MCDSRHDDADDKKIVVELEKQSGGWPRRCAALQNARARRSQPLFVAFFFVLPSTVEAALTIVRSIVCAFVYDSHDSSARARAMIIASVERHSRARRLQADASKMRMESAAFYKKSSLGNQITLDTLERQMRPQGANNVDSYDLASAPTAASSLTSSIRSSKGRSAPGPSPSSNYSTATTTATSTIGRTATIAPNGRGSYTAHSTLDRLNIVQRRLPSSSPPHTLYEQQNQQQQSIGTTALASNGDSQRSSFRQPPAPPSSTANGALSSSSTLTTPITSATVPPLSTLGSSQDGGGVDSAAVNAISPVMTTINSAASTDDQTRRSCGWWTLYASTLIFKVREAFYDEK